MWVGSTYGRLVASFSWALLDRFDKKFCFNMNLKSSPQNSIIDVDIFPPKFRPIYEVTNVTDKTESVSNFYINSYIGLSMHRTCLLIGFIYKVFG